MAIVLCDNDMTRNLGYKYRIKDLCGTHIFLNVVILSRPGHEKPRTEDRTKKNREPEPNLTETENFGSISVPSSQEPK